MLDRRALSVCSWDRYGIKRFFHKWGFLFVNVTPEVYTDPWPGGFRSISSFSFSACPIPSSFSRTAACALKLPGFLQHSHCSDKDVELTHRLASLSLVFSGAVRSQFTGRFVEGICLHPGVGISVLFGSVDAERKRSSKSDCCLLFVCLFLSKTKTEWEKQIAFGSLAVKSSFIHRLPFLPVEHVSVTGEAHTSFALNFLSN